MSQPVCTLVTYVLRSTAKYEYDHHDSLNKFKIRLHARHLAIPASRFVFEHIIDCPHVCDVANRVAKAIVVELTVHAAANVVELFMHTVVILQTTPFLDARLVTWSYELSRLYE